MRFSKKRIIFSILGGLLFFAYVGAQIVSQVDEIKSNKGMPVAILGDSDSHSYHDSYDNKARGGQFHEFTFNWPALWERFRSEEVDLGKFDSWGQSYRIARFKNWLGLPARAPRKLDFDYNYAVSGLRCNSLLESWPYQAKWLIKRIQRSPSFWDQGLVIIRIGVNNLGSTKQLIRWGNTGLDEHALSIVDTCVQQITDAIMLIIETSPNIKIALLGMCRDCNITDTYSVWPKLSNIEKRDQVLGDFDKKLMKFSAQHKNVLFIDDTKWLTKRYGDRYNEPIKFNTMLANKIKIISQQGDHPRNLILADYHAGTVYNGFWLNNLISQLNSGFRLSLKPLSEEEIYSVIEQAINPKSN